MLKIKDNVDLKKLENFEFEHKDEFEDYPERYIYNNYDSFDEHTAEVCFVLVKNRRILYQSLDSSGDILFDLISAGLVEKI